MFVFSSYHALSRYDTYFQQAPKQLACDCSQPADKYPDMFSQTGLFGRFPFALPTMIAAVLSLVGTHGSHCRTLHRDTAELVLALL